MAQMSNGGGKGRSAAMSVEGVIEGQKVRDWRAERGMDFPT